MPDTVCPSSTELAALERLCRSATESASAAMRGWLGASASLALDRVREVPLSDVCTDLEIDQELLTIVVLGSTGGLDTNIVLMFGENVGRDLAARLLGRAPDDSPEWDELENSALTETGNIVACAYLNAIARLIQTDLLPTPPMLMRDYGASVVQQALLTQAAECDQVLICETTFQQDGQVLDARVLLLPTQATRQRIEKAFSSGH